MVKLLSYAGFNIIVKPNDYVYIIHHREPIRVKVIYITLNEYGEFSFGVNRGIYSYHFSVVDIGRYVFLTEKDALVSVLASIEAHKNDSVSNEK